MKTELKSIIIAVSLLLSVQPGNSTTAQKPPQPLSVHVIDNESGENGVNITCMIYRLEGTEFSLLSTQSTNSNGRILEFIPFEDNTPGTYKIWFGTKAYYNNRNISTFFSAVQITYEVTDPLIDYHVPLILSPYGFSTYRESSDTLGHFECK